MIQNVKNLVEKIMKLHGDIHAGEPSYYIYDDTGNVRKIMEYIYNHEDKEIRYNFDFYTLLQPNESRNSYKVFQLEYEYDLKEIVLRDVIQYPDLSCFKKGMKTVSTNRPYGASIYVGNNQDIIDCFDYCYKEETDEVLKVSEMGKKPFQSYKNIQPIKTVDFVSSYTKAFFENTIHASFYMKDVKSVVLSVYINETDYTSYILGIDEETSQVYCELKIPVKRNMSDSYYGLDTFTILCAETLNIILTIMQPYTELSLLFPNIKTIFLVDVKRNVQAYLDKGLKNLYGDNYDARNIHVIAVYNLSTLPCIDGLEKSAEIEKTKEFIISNGENMNYGKEVSRELEKIMDDNTNTISLSAYPWYYNYMKYISWKRDCCSYNNKDFDHMGGENK